MCSFCVFLHQALFMHFIYWLMGIIGMFVQNLKMQESEFQSNCNVKRSELQADVMELEGRIASDWNSKIPSDSLNHSLIESSEELHSAKKVL